MPEGALSRLHIAAVVIEALGFLRQVLGAIAVLLIVRFSQGKADTLDLWFALAAGILSVIPALFTYFTFRYGIVDGALVVTKGILFKQHRTIPLERIQNVQIRRTLVHRLLKVAAVDVETASGAGSEASLLAVGDADADRLRLELLNRVHTAERCPVELPPLYRASTKNLLIAGATQNRALLIVAGIVGLFGFLQDALDWKLTNLARQAMAQELNVYLAFGGFLALFLAGWVLSIGMSIVTYYGFTLKTATGGLQVRHGLFTQLENVIPVRRVQALRVEAPAFQRLMKVCQVYVVTAGSFEDKSTGGSAPLCPLIDRAEADHFAQLIYPSFSFEEIRWAPISPFARGRAFVLGCLWWGLLAFVLTRFVGGTAWWLLIAGIPYQWLYANLWHKGQAWARSGNFLLKRDGALGRSFQVVPLDRIQWASVSQSPTQRRLGLASLVATTAGQGHGASLHIPYIREEEATALQSELTNVRHGRTLESGGL